MIIQNFTHDRYAEQPPFTWIGQYWLSTNRDDAGRYLRGLIVDVRPGAVRVEWPALEGRAFTAEWTPMSKGTLARE